MPGPSQVRGVLRYRVRADARSDPAHDQVVTGIAARLAGLSRCAVMLAEDETHLNLPHVRASRTARPTSGVLAPATNRKVTVLGWSR